MELAGGIHAAGGARVVQFCRTYNIDAIVAPGNEDQAIPPVSSTRIVCK